MTNTIFEAYDSLRDNSAYVAPRFPRMNGNGRRGLGNRNGVERSRSSLISVTIAALLLPLRKTSKQKRPESQVSMTGMKYCWAELINDLTMTQ
jgi:hypothetical protein